MEATINYAGSNACFTITEQDPGIYVASLVECEAGSRLVPPNNIVLTKGFRQWAGSCDDEVLLNELGKVIEMQTNV